MQKLKRVTAFQVQLVSRFPKNVAPLFVGDKCKETLSPLIIVFNLSLTTVSDL